MLWFKFRTITRLTYHFENLYVYCAIFSTTRYNFDIILPKADS